MHPMSEGVEPESEEMMEPAGQESAVSEEEGGFEILLLVRPDGTYSVNGEAVDSLEQALKEVMRLVQDNPVSGSVGDQLDAGYRSGNGPSDSGAR